MHVQTHAYYHTHTILSLCTLLRSLYLYIHDHIYVHYMTHDQLRSSALLAALFGREVMTTAPQRVSGDVYSCLLLLLCRDRRTLHHIT
jgi:hypothetical protein